MINRRKHLPLSSIRLQISLLISSVFFLSACFRMGMPEHFAPMLDTKPRYEERAGLSALRTSTGPTAVVIQETNAASSVSESLGNQYVLGLIPVTRVYFEHGAITQAEEALIESLLIKGFDVLTVSKDHAANLIAGTKPDLALAVSLNSVNIDAYDALFFRITKGKGDLSLTNYSVNNSRSLLKQKSRPITFEVKQYRRSGHGPILSDMIYRQLRQSFNDEIPDPLTIVSPRRKPNSSASAKLQRALVVLAPSFEEPIAENTRRLVAESYGYKGVAPISSESLSRVLQRGLILGARGTNTPTIGSSSKSSPFISKALSPIILRTTVKSIGLAEDYLTIKGQYSLLDWTQGVKPKELVTKPFQKKVEILRETDGYWITTLEKAMSNLAGDILSNPKRVTN